MEQDEKDNLENIQNENTSTVEQPLVEQASNTNTDSITNTQKEVSAIDDNFIEDVFKSNYIDLYKLEGLDVKDQSRVFSLVLTDIYKGYNEVDYSSIRKSVLKCLKLSCEPDDNTLRLPYRLMVNKDGNKMYFKFEDQTKKNLWLFFLIFALFLFTALGSSYVALRYLSIAHLNLDIDGDGVADLNIDMNSDDKEEINIAPDNKKPEVNVDYKGNREPVFNVDTTGDGKPDSNTINQDHNSDGICDLNCDIDGDGWPDLNIDIDGDGKPDLYIDTDDDEIADLNFDTNGDKKCDLHCDTNEDELCDLYCVQNVEVVEENTGSSAAVGNSGTDVETATFVVDFIDSKLIKIDNLYPEDQKDNVLKSVTKKITIHNKSTQFTRYKIELVVTNYTFESDNFEVKIDSDNNGYKQDFKKVPDTTTFIADQIGIAPGVIQSYTFTFRLRGINANQNFDQGKSFSGYFQVYIIDNPQE